MTIASASSGPKPPLRFVAATTPIIFPSVLSGAKMAFVGALERLELAVRVGVAREIVRDVELAGAEDHPGDRRLVRRDLELLRELLGQVPARPRGFEAVRVGIVEEEPDALRVREGRDGGRRARLHLLQVGRRMRRPQQAVEAMERLDAPLDAAPHPVDRGREAAELVASLLPRHLDLAAPAHGLGGADEPARRAPRCAARPRARRRTRGGAAGRTGEPCPAAVAQSSDRRTRRAPPRGARGGRRKGPRRRSSRSRGCARPRTDARARGIGRCRPRAPRRRPPRARRRRSGSSESSSRSVSSPRQRISSPAFAGITSAWPIPSSANQRSPGRPPRSTACVA